MAGTGRIRAESSRLWAQRMAGAAATSLGLLQDHSDGGEWVGTCPHPSLFPEVGALPRYLSIREGQFV